MTAPLQLGFATAHDPGTVKGQGGLGYFMHQAMVDAGISLQSLGPLADVGEFFLRIKRGMCQTFTGQLHLSEVEPSRLRNYANQLSSRIGTQPFQLVLGLGIWPMAYLDTELPCAVWSEFCFAALRQLDVTYANLCPASRKAAEVAEGQLLRRCRVAIFTSDWAAQAAIEAYELDPARIHVVPYGANMAISRSVDEVRAMVAGRPTDVCRLLWVGTDWKRKGGDFAVQVTEELNRMGFKTELRVVGCKPELTEHQAKVVKSFGYLSKALREGRSTLERMYSEAHFLLLPAASETFPQTVCEASAFGVPTVGFNVGGIPAAIKDDANGRLFSDTTPATKVASYIGGIFGLPERYGELAMSSFNEYRERLNWPTAIAQVKEHLAAAL